MKGCALIFLPIIFLLACPISTKAQGTQEIDRCDFELVVDPRIDSMVTTVTLLMYCFPGIRKRQREQLRKKLHLHCGELLGTDKAFYLDRLSELCEHKKLVLKKVELKLVEAGQGQNNLVSLTMELE